MPAVVLSFLTYTSYILLCGHAILYYAVIFRPTLQTAWFSGLTITFQHYVIIDTASIGRAFNFDTLKVYLLHRPNLRLLICLPFR